jgi:hypothetical protein
VLPNGHLLIAGEKQIGVNHNVDVLRFSGQVDPAPSSRATRRVGPDRQRARRAQGRRRPGRCAGNWLARRFFLNVLPFKVCPESVHGVLNHSPRCTPWKRPDNLIKSLSRKACIGLIAVILSGVFWWPRRCGMRIKEVASVQGVRTNQLTGYGLVVGLDGTGDQTTQAPFTAQSLNAMLQQIGVTVPPGTSMQLKNVAAVMVTAQLPPFAQPGQQIDVNVSSMGNAKSLRGGTLIATPLRGADGQIYALAQGNLIVGGAGASPAAPRCRSTTSAPAASPKAPRSNVPCPRRCCPGRVHPARPERSSDYATARAVAQRHQRAKGAGVAQALDGRVVRVRMPVDPTPAWPSWPTSRTWPLELATRRPPRS